MKKRPLCESSNRFMFRESFEIMRFAAIIFVSLLAGLSVGGCSGMKPGSLNAVQPVTSNPRVGNAYLLRGFIGIFSTGIDALGVQIAETGVHAQVFQDDQWSSLAAAIADHYKDKQAEPLILIGHSYGADDVVRIARKLDETNIPVDLLVTLDPVTPPDVPKNVKLCVNLYQSNGVMDSLPWLRGIPLKQDKDASGKLINSNIRTDRTDLLEPGLDHFNIEKKQKIHNEVIKMVLSECPSRPQWVAQQQREQQARNVQKPASPPPMAQLPAAMPAADTHKPIASNDTHDSHPWPD
jgi:hypothetical protein